ncbi:PadR family transcriptional regulator [Conexibacter arvalis]|uniref:PadR family transcriptional regulator PadR n=1 Tax=Conexibacter arvalis TaxID=912552 RepID=A0A840IIF1_9ACTN|nr:helix-turn-helix transcriptional regulator [Conexibacter arvalis]MBB4663730.1 PadR family transcriptional regulator PadR [Conexibacter arvalis]
MKRTDQRPAWLRGVLDLCLLALLDEGEAYGYELARRLEELGFGAIPGGSLYPALLRREKLGHLRAEWRAGDGGPGRKYYVLTPAGRAALSEERAAWRAFAGSVEAALAGAEAAR